MDNTTMITMPLLRYEQLIKTEHQYALLVAETLKAARLNYDRESLSYNDEQLCRIFGIIAPEQYERRLKELGGGAEWESQS